MSAEFEIQKGLFSSLSASPVDGLVSAIYDAAPQVADGGDAGEYPYIEIGTILISEMDTKTRNGFDWVARVHTRSRSASMRETKEIQGAIYDALHLQTPAVAGYKTILLRREMSDVMRTPEGSFHGVCEYRGLMDKT